MDDRTIGELLALLPDAALVVDAAGRIAMANPGAERLFGFARGTLAGTAVDALVPEAMRARHAGHRARFLPDGATRPMGAALGQLLARRSDGGQFPVEIALAPLPGDGPPRVLATVRDASEGWRVREAITRARLDRFVLAFGQAALAARDDDEAIGLLPAQLSGLLGLPAVAVVARLDAGDAFQCSAWSGIAGAPESVAGLVETVAGSHSINAGVTTVLLGAGHDDQPGLPADLLAQGFLQATVMPLAGHEGILGALVALSHDELALDHDARYCLEATATMLAAFLQRRRSEQQLAHAQRLEAIGHLAGGLAHDFNNLLGVISCSLQMLELECTGDERAHRLITDAHQAVSRGASLTGKLLNFVRGQQLMPCAIAAGPMLEQFAAMAQRLLGDDIHVEVACAADSGALLADPAMLEAALLNMAINARDAMPGGGRLRLSARRIEALPTAASPDTAAAYVMITVADSGTGMPRRVLERAFEPLYTTKPVGQGNGLGLTMVHGFAVRSGGHVRVNSVPGKGTRIDLCLPAASAAPSPAPAP